jgi:hypothetical protein
VKGWYERHAGWLAILFASLAFILLAVVSVQAVMLHSRGWRLVMGSLPEWVSAGGTVIAAFGVLAAFGSLRIVRREWESQQAERRDELANQARLIVVEDVPRAEMVPPANQARPRPDGKPEYRYVVIRNHSQEPVFNVRIPDGSSVETKKTLPWVTSVAEVRAQKEDGSFFSPTPTVVHQHPPELVPVLAPGQATFQLDLQTVPRDEQVTEHVYFTFTDARGARWQRLGSEQPKPQID